MRNTKKWVGVGIVARRDSGGYMVYYPAVVRLNGEVLPFRDGYTYEDLARGVAQSEARWAEVPYLGYVREGK